MVMKKLKIFKDLFKFYTHEDSNQIALGLCKNIFACLFSVRNTISVYTSSASMFN